MGSRDTVVASRSRDTVASSRAPVPGSGPLTPSAPSDGTSHTPETKAFFKTSEFAVWTLTVIGLLIAGAVVDASKGSTDAFRANTVWTLITIVSFAYIISRGISKAGTKYR